MGGVLNRQGICTGGWGFEKGGGNPPFSPNPHPEQLPREKIALPPRPLPMGDKSRRVRSSVRGRGGAGCALDNRGVRQKWWCVGGEWSKIHVHGKKNKKCGYPPPRRGPGRPRAKGRGWAPGERCPKPCPSTCHPHPGRTPEKKKMKREKKKNEKNGFAPKMALFMS